MDAQNQNVVERGNADDCNGASKENKSCCRSFGDLNDFVLEGIEDNSNEKKLSQNSLHKSDDFPLQAKNSKIEKKKRHRKSNQMPAEDLVSRTTLSKSRSKSLRGRISRCKDVEDCIDGYPRFSPEQ